MVDLVVDSRTERCTTTRDWNCFVETDDIVIGIKNRRDDQCLIVDVSLLEIDKERCFLLGDRTAEVCRHTAGFELAAAK